MEKKSRWQVYHGRPNHVQSDGPRVTLNHRSVFLLNEKAYEALGSPAAVEFRFDEETRTIGLAPKDPRVQNAFPLKAKTNHKKYRYRTIQGTPFCKQFGITPRGTLLFTDIDMDNEGTLLLELKTAVAVGRGFR